MFKVDALEAAPIVRQAMQKLMQAVADPATGSDARTAIGDLLAHLDALLQDDAIGEPLADCFDLARAAGATADDIAFVYEGVIIEAPSTQGGILIKVSLLNFCFANVSRLIVDMRFRSRDDIDQAKQRLNSVFAVVEEIVADAMDSVIYAALVRLHAATVRFLVETARPLPRMLEFRFAAPQPTLVAAHRLYNDAARADELREENKVVHPAFMRPSGRALSA